MRIPAPKIKGQKPYKPPTISEPLGAVIDISDITPSQAEEVSLNEKLKKLFKYLDPTDNGLYIKGALKSPNFVRNKKGFGVNINNEGDAFFKSITAGSYIQVFVQATVPTSLHINDIWYKSDDSYKKYYAVIAGATTIAAGQWVEANYQDDTLALAAQAELDDISADTKITPVEKLTLKPLWNAVVAEKTDIDTQADSYSVSKVAYGTAYTNLNTYLNTTITVFANMTATTTIVRATWDGYWEAYYNAKIEILNAIADATDGATFGDNIAGGGTGNTQVGNDGYATLFRQSIFGDGSDGDKTVSTNESLTADVYYNNLTINNGIILNSNGFKIFVKGTLNCVGTGKIIVNGNAGGAGATGAGAGGAGGAAGIIAYSAGSLPIPLVGKVGGAGDDDGNAPAGIAGSNQAKALANQDAVAGGHGGTTSEGSAGSGGAGGAAGTKTGTISASPHYMIAAYNLYDLSGGTITQFGVAPSSGSGGGGGGAKPGAEGIGGGGGGSGSSGGVAWISAKIITTLNVEAKGGDGGKGGNSSADGAYYRGGVGGGGGGGNGGAIILIYSTSTTINTNITGGTGGAIGDLGHTTDATAGANGNVGLLIELQI